MTPPTEPTVFCGSCSTRLTPAPLVMQTVIQDGVEEHFRYVDALRLQLEAAQEREARLIAEIATLRQEIPLAFYEGRRFQKHADVSL